MAKKKRKKKSHEPIPFIVFAPDTSSREEQEPSVQISSFVMSEPGWKAVFAPCVSCESGPHEKPIVFWALMTSSDGGSGISGLIGGSEGGFWQADVEHTFVGYAKPGESADEILSEFFRPN